MPRAPRRHVRAAWCDCLACYAGLLALDLPAPEVVPDVTADRLVRGPGERRVCARDSECLSEWMRGPLAEEDAHCPPGCVRWAPLDRWQLLHEAIVGRADGDDRWPDTRDLAPGPTRGKKREAR